jgi:urea transport system permease protein
MILQFAPRSFCILLISFLCVAASFASGAPPVAPVSQDIIDGFKGLKTADADGRQKFYDLIAQKGDARLIPALSAYRSGTLLLHAGTSGAELAIYGDRVDVAGQGSMLPLIDAITAQPINGPDGKPLLFPKIDLSDAIKAPPFREKRSLANMISGLSLNDPDPAKHKAAIRDAGDRTDDSLLPALKTQLATDPNGPFSTDVREAIARLELQSGTHDEKMAAATELGTFKTNRSLTSLERAQEKAKDDAPLLAAINSSIAACHSYQSRISFIQDTFAGLSLGSILVLLALGLSIIFGLMGVINMAHGEFMMIGAFTTYVISEFFRAHFPGIYDWYPIVAIPMAFAVAGFAGFICEWLVIRHLYGRPLETLLATWGIGMILIQFARGEFGDNLSVRPPSWIEGGIEVAPDLFFPLNRIYIIGFCAACIGMVYFIVNKTKLGLLLRATTQNREMAAALGVATRRVDALTFAFGTGLAGLAGVAVPMYNKINPSIGQEYIVDSFMVVVVGGVGKLAGAIIAGLGLGFINKYIEPILQSVPSLASGATVLGKVIVLALIVIFLQFRPAGLFPPKGRMADN